MKRTGADRSADSLSVEIRTGGQGGTGIYRYLSPCPARSFEDDGFTRFGLLAARVVSRFEGIEE